MGRKKYINVPCVVVEDGKSEPCGKPSEVLKWKMCFSHYRRMQRYGNPGEPVRRTYTNDPNNKYPKSSGEYVVWEPKEVRTCDVEGCDDVHMAKGLCEFHYRVEYEKRRVRPSRPIVKGNYQKNHQRRRDAEGSVSLSEMRDLLNAHGYKCLYCESPINEMTHSKNRDHVVPISRGGSNWIENHAPCCKECNYSKGGKTLSEFRRYQERVRMMTDLR